MLKIAREGRVNSLNWVFSVLLRGSDKIVLSAGLVFLSLSRDCDIIVLSIGLKCVAVT